MANVFKFVILITVFNCVYLQTVDNKRQKQLRKVYKNICGKEITEDLLEDINDCEESLPGLVRTNFNQCVKEVMKVKKINKPLLCYRAQGGEKLKTCLVRRARALAKKAPGFIDLEGLRNKVLDKYAKCMAEVIT